MRAPSVLSSDAISHRGVLKLAWPILVTMLSHTALTLVNAIWIGQLGTVELAAMGIASSLWYLVTAFGSGLVSSVRIPVANRTGAGAHEDARAFAWQGVWLAVVLGFAVTALAGIGPTAFAWMGASPEVAAAGADYYLWRTLGTPAWFLFLGLTAALQGRGDTRTPMVANLVANALNFVIDPVLIFGLGPVPALGTAGAAIGTGISTVAGLAVLVARSGLGRAVLPDRARLRAVAEVGAPQAVQYLLDVASFNVFAALLASSGDDHLAAHVIVVRIVMVSFLPCYALSEATSVLVGQSLGAGRPDDARKALGFATIQAVALMLSLGVVFAAIPDLLLGVFGASATVVAIARPIVVLYAAMQTLDGMLIVAIGALSGAGDTRFVLRLTVLAAWFVKLPVAVALVRGLELGAFGAWVGIGAEIAAMLVAAGWRARGGAWLRATPATVVTT